MYMLATACNDPDILRIIYFAKMLLEVAFVIVPIALIVMLMVDFAKLVIAHDDSQMKKLQSLAIRRIITAMGVFSVPSLVGIVVGTVNQTTGYMSCLANANMGMINQYQVIKDAEREALNNSLSEKNSSSVATAKESQVRDMVKKQERAKVISEKARLSSSSSNSSSGNGSAGYTPGSAPNFLQYDSQWASKSLCNGNGTMQSAGCGYTSLAVVVNMLGNSDANPANVTDYICSLGIEDGRAINDETLVNSGLLSHYNVAVSDVMSRSEASSAANEEKKKFVLSALERGEPVIILIPNHYIVAAAKSGDKITIVNPGSSTDAPSGTYTIDELFNQTDNYKDRCNSNGVCGWKYLIAYKKA